MSHRPRTTVHSIISINNIRSWRGKAHSAVRCGHESTTSPRIDCRFLRGMVDEPPIKNDGALHHLNKQYPFLAQKGAQRRPLWSRIRQIACKSSVFLFGEDGGANPPNQERRQSIKTPQNKTRSCCGKALCAVRCGHEFSNRLANASPLRQPRFKSPKCDVPCISYTFML